MQPTFCNLWWKTPTDLPFRISIIKNLWFCGVIVRYSHGHNRGPGPTADLSLTCLSTRLSGVCIGGGGWAQG